MTNDERTVCATVLPRYLVVGLFLAAMGSGCSDAPSSPTDCATDAQCTHSERCDVATHVCVLSQPADVAPDSLTGSNNTSYAYSLAGVPQSDRYFAGTLCGPLMVGSMVDPAHQAFLDLLFDKNVSAFSTSYYVSELQLLPLIIASGNWWRP